MAKLTLQQLRKELNTFLKENNCCSKFHVNAAKTHGKWVSRFKVNVWLDFKHVTKEAMEQCPLYVITDGFPWEETPEGEDHWRDIDTKWKEFVHSKYSYYVE